MFLYKVTYFLAVLRESVLIICAGYVACGFITGTVILRTVLYVYFYNLPLREVLSYSMIWLRVFLNKYNFKIFSSIFIFCKTFCGFPIITLLNLLKIEK